MKPAKEARTSLIHLAEQYEQAAICHRATADDLEKHAAQIRADAAAIKDDECAALQS